MIKIIARLRGYFYNLTIKRFVQFSLNKYLFMASEFFQIFSFFRNILYVVKRIDIYSLFVEDIEICVPIKFMSNIFTLGQGTD